MLSVLNLNDILIVLILSSYKFRDVFLPAYWNTNARKVAEVKRDSIARSRLDPDTHFLVASPPFFKFEITMSS